MKKKQLKKMVEGLDKFSIMNERHMQIQDNAIIKKDEEISILTDAAKELKVQLEETQEALRRSRNFVRIIQSDKRRSIKDMAKDLYLLFDKTDIRPWKNLSEEDQEHWMGLVVEILSGDKLGRG